MYFRDSGRLGCQKYDVSEKQIAALQQALTQVKSKPLVDSPADKLHLTMTRMNCYACHQRGEVGGPSDVKSDYFVYERVVDLGDEGRLPPPLHDVGAKLTHEGFEDMLFGGQKYRTYMATRMPQFGKENVGHVVPLFEKLDADKVPSHKPEFSPRLVDDGRFLMGNKALSCINCHAWGDERLPGAEGMDLLQTPRRLKPSWFHAWLKDPAVDAARHTDAVRLAGGSNVLQRCSERQGRCADRCDLGLPKCRRKGWIPARTIT